VDAEVKRWGNSFAIRLPKSEAERLGVREGDHVEVELRKRPRRKRGSKIDLSGMPVLHDTATDVSERHDDYLYGWRRGKR
jgi:antitoxin component of MazEF toxin-antitoxin module